MAHGAASQPALLGGVPAIAEDDETLFRWPILTQTDEQAVLSALRDTAFPDDQLIRQFETDLAHWIGAAFVSSETSGTSAIAAALFACGVGVGDEVIVPACTYWATCMPVLTFGATPVFCDVDPRTLNIDPRDIEKRLSPRTKAIVVAHLLGQPCDMQAINGIARRAGVPVIEDAAHAFGSRLEGRRIGQTADICAFSFSRKALSLSEGGAVVTDRRDLYERVLAWGHTERFFRPNVQAPELLSYANVPLGGVTSRLHVLSAAMGIVQLGQIDARIAEIDAAMHDFCDLLDGLDCVSAIRAPRGGRTTMGPWYTPHALYDPAATGGLSLARFQEALCAEGFDTWTWGGFTNPLHLHPAFQSADIYGHGRPSAIAYADTDRRLAAGDLPVAESISAFALPAFRRHDTAAFRRYADAVYKVVDNAPALMSTD